jgi:hypothetical protein
MTVIRYAIEKADSIIACIKTLTFAYFILKKNKPRTAVNQHELPEDTGAGSC